MAPKFNIRSCFFIPLLLAVALALSSRPVAAQAPPPLSSNPQNGLFSQTNFTPSMSIIVIVLIASFFFLGLFSIYVRMCAGERSEGAGPVAHTPAVNRQPRGLDPAIIESFPTMAYSEVKEHKVGKGALECAVCLSEFEDDEKLRLLPKCSHVFHPDCIDAWLAGHATCPVCRYNLTVYESGEIPNPDATTADGDSAPAAAATEITRQEEETSAADPPADAVILEVKTETEEERREREEAMELERIRNVRRGVRSKGSRRPSRFPRSHSTGHSLSSADRAGEDPDRYTLRIPEPVLRQIIAEGKLKRSTSLVSFRETGEGSSRRGYRETGEGSSRGGRSVRMFVRNLSERFSSWGIGRRGGEGEGSVKGEGSTGRGRLGSVRVQFDCLAGGAPAAAKAESGEGSVGRRVYRVNAG